MSNKQYYDYKIKEFVEKYPSFKGMQDYHQFILLCIKNFFYNDASIPFDQDLVKYFITDGSNDGGIDAVFNDPTSESNDLIIVQSKYVENTAIKDAEIIGELAKVADTLKKIKNNKVADLNPNMLEQYKKTEFEMENDAQTKIYFFTTYTPPTQKARLSIQKNVNQYFEEFGDIVINFEDDIHSEIDMNENGSLLVEYDELELDKANNYLQYNESVLVNIKASSLQNLRIRRKDSLLGLNLRFHIQDKKVDKGIIDTIQKDSKNFWYKNNGIVIICDDFTISGNKLKLKEFSIINGGQTTAIIGKTDIPDGDFLIQCKVVKSQGKNEDEKVEFLNNIARATNSQKPIKIADLKANDTHQVKLKKKFNEIGIFYITKKGEKAQTKKFTEPYEITNLEQVGKLSLASVLQMPGSSRSNSKKMYQDEYYYQIFGDSSKPCYVKDTIKISYYYEKFTKTNISFFSEDSQAMIKNGKTFTLATIGFLAKLEGKVIDYEKVKLLIDNTDELKKHLARMDGIDCLIANKIDNEKTLMNEIFSIIGDEVLGFCYFNAKERAKRQGTVVAPSDYLKDDQNYYKDVLARVIVIYNKNVKFSQNFKTLFLKNEK